MKDGQEAGEMLLDIEARIGEMLPSSEEAQRGAIKQRGIPKSERASGHIKVLPDGISGQRAQQARAISKHPEIVEKVKAQARENETKVENLLFALWVQDQRHDYWMKVVREIRAGLENLKEEMWDGRLFHSD